MARARRQVAFSAKSKKRRLPPPKKHSSRDREYLRPDEVEALMKAARRLGRHGERDAAMVLLMFRHGLRTAELVSLKWSQVDLKRGYLDVKRARAGTTRSTRLEVRNFGHPAAPARVPQIALHFRIGAGSAAFAEVCSAHHRSRWGEGRL